MKLGPFLFYTAVGAAIWTAALTYAGVLLGYNYPLVEKYISPVAMVVIGALTLAWVLHVARRWRRRASGPA
jgi:membrane protein DedA with SNARE-associated domain